MRGTISYIDPKTQSVSLGENFDLGEQKVHLRQQSSLDGTHSLSFQMADLASKGSAWETDKTFTVTMKDGKLSATRREDDYGSSHHWSESPIGVNLLPDGSGVTVQDGQDNYAVPWLLSPNLVSEKPSLAQRARNLFLGN